MQGGFWSQNQRAGFAFFFLFFFGQSRSFGPLPRGQRTGRRRIEGGWGCEREREMGYVGRLVCFVLFCRLGGGGGGGVRERERERISEGRVRMIFFDQGEKKRGKVRALGAIVFFCGCFFCVCEACVFFVLVVFLKGMGGRCKPFLAVCCSVARAVGGGGGGGGREKGRGGEERAEGGLLLLVPSCQPF